MRRRITDLRRLGHVLRDAGEVCGSMADGFQLELHELAATKKTFSKMRRKKYVTRKSIAKAMIATAQGMKLSGKSRKYPITKKNIRAFKKLAEIASKTE